MSCRIASSLHFFHVHTYHLRGRDSHRHRARPRRCMEEIITTQKKKKLQRIKEEPHAGIALSYPCIAYYIVTIWCCARTRAGLLSSRAECFTLPSGPRFWQRLYSSRTQNCTHAHMHEVSFLFFSAKPVIKLLRVRERTFVVVQ
jgi:hypothetical protein